MAIAASKLLTRALLHPPVGLSDPLTKVESRFTRAQPLRRFLSYVIPHWRLVAGAALAGTGKFTLPLLFPLAYKYAVDVIIQQVPNPGPVDLAIDRLCTWLAAIVGLPASSASRLGAMTALMIVIFLLHALCAYYATAWASLAGHSLIFDLRNALFRHVQSQANSFYDRNSSGALLSTFMNDVGLAQNFVASALTNVWIDTVSLVVILAILFELDARMAWVALSVMPFYAFTMRYFAPRIKQTSHAVQQATQTLSHGLQERLAGAVTTKAFGREAVEAQWFHTQTSVLFEHTIRNVFLASRQQMITEFITRIAPVIVVSAASVMILRGELELGTLVAVICYLGHFYLPLQRFSELSIVISNSLAAIERIMRVFDQRSEINEHPLATPLRVKRGDVQFEKVSFAYSAHPHGSSRMALSDVSFEVPGGTMVALVGPSGAGKTTLAALIPRFYDPTFGRVRIDGRDIRYVTLASLRQNVGIVTQEVTLFGGTVRENLRYGEPDASEGKMWWALEQANLRDFVEALPGKLDAVLGEGGIKLSGGQRQRLAVARIFLKNPAVLILDEATSALDSESESLVRDAIRRLCRGRTCFIIAHRLESAVEADVILVLERGRLVEVGAHRELLARGGVYARLFNQQAGALVPELGFPNGHFSQRSEATNFCGR